MSGTREGPGLGARRGRQDVPVGGVARARAGRQSAAAVAPFLARVRRLRRQVLVAHHVWNKNKPQASWRYSGVFNCADETITTQLYIMLRHMCNKYIFVFVSGNTARGL